MIHHLIFGGARRVGPVVQAVVRRGDGAVLLSERRTLRGWELPGGGLEPGEEEREGLRREVLEETGIDVRVVDRVGHYRRRGLLGHRAVVYRCEAQGGELATSWETPVVAWFATDALPSTLFPWFRGPLEDALADEHDLEREEELGLAAVWVGMKVDLRTRMRGSETDTAIQTVSRR